MGWYALKVWRNRAALIGEIGDDGFETYIASTIREDFSSGRMAYKEVPLVPSLVFLNASEGYVLELKKKHPSDFFYYKDVATGLPGRIDDREMEMFRLVTRVPSADVSLFRDEGACFRKGDKVRVTSGIFKGAEGYVRRIGKDRKLLVQVSGVTAVLVSNIPPAFLEKVPGVS